MMIMRFARLSPKGRHFGPLALALACTLAAGQGRQAFASTHDFQSAEAHPQSGWTFKILIDQRGQAQILEAREHALFVTPERERSYPASLEEGQPSSPESIVEISGPNTWVKTRLLARGIPAKDITKAFDAKDLRRLERESTRDELRTLVESGPSENRIDLVFMGDGYTEQEKAKFFADMDRLVRDLFEQDTFSSYLPLFNVHAVFRASQSSGLPRGRPGNTAYGLYREGNTFRAIFPGNQQALRDSCRVAPECDYPVVVANDDFYGGLGGEFAITTRSLTSGTIVLRHELGHNFGRVGEEYDGGGYFGRNHSPRANRLSWSEWLDDTTKAPEPANLKALALAWPWQSLATGPFAISINTSNERPYRELKMSLFGLEGTGRYQVRINGREVDAPTLTTNDRSFVTIALPRDLGAGRQELEVTALDPDGDEMIASFAIHEYDFDPASETDPIGAYALYNGRGQREGFRPTNNSCLMRNMLHPAFCSVCQENNWRELLGRLNLIDKSSVKRAANGDLVAELDTLELGQFREQGVPLDPFERLGIRWTKDGEELSEFKDQAAIRIPRNLWPEEESGALAVQVIFETSEIRAPGETFWRSQKNFSIRPPGGLRQTIP